MTRGVKAAIASTVVITAVCGIASAAFGWFMWALALNGFMGQQRAAEISMAVYIVMAVGAVIVGALLSGLIVYWLAGKRSWNAVGSAVLSCAIFIVGTSAVHFGCVLVSVLVADGLRTNR